LRSAPAGAVGRGPGRRQAAAWHHRGVNADARVCPFCGEPPGVGVFCEACGRNLSAVEQLPTRGEWEAGAPVAPDESLAERCAEAVAAFLAAMHAAGDPGTADVFYRVDINGEISQIWILTAEESKAAADAAKK